MKRLHLVALLAILAITLTGCQGMPENAIEMETPQFKYKGCMVWLYRNSSGEIGMLSGTYLDVSTMIVPQSLFPHLEAGIKTVGAGEWTSNRKVSRNLIIYIKDGILEGDLREQLPDQADHVLYVSLGKVKADMPKISSEEELKELKRQFEAALKEG